jgi:uncharacterized membrane protein YgcG
MQLSRVMMTLFAAIGICAGSANAQKAIHDVDILVKIDAVGTAHISEKWDVEAVKGTEWYLMMSNLREGMVVKDVSVSDEAGKNYSVDEGNWDTHRTLEEKSGRCGILKESDSHYEVCWGLGSYGHHVYRVSYVLTNLVQSLNDKDAFNHKFLSDKLSSDVERVRVIITMDSLTCGKNVFSPSNTKIWAFGSEKCYLQMRDGKIICGSKYPLDQHESVIIMASFDKGLFRPLIHQDRDFKEMRDNALNNDSYGSDDEVDDSFIGFLLLSFFIFVTAFIIFMLVLDERKKRKRVFGTAKRIDGWCHELPFDGNLFAANYALHAGQIKTKSNALEGALMLRWIQKKIITVKMGKRTNDIEIAFDHQENECLITNNSEKLLFDLLKTASGDDLVLQKDELGKYMEKKSGFSAMKEWNEAIISEGEQALVAANMANYRSHNKTLFNNLVFNDKGMEAARKMMQYKNYLRDDTDMRQREVPDISILNEHLVFALLLGIADKVSKRFEKLYPEYRSSIEGNGLIANNDFLLYYLFMNNFQNSFANSQADSFDGSGGMSSFGGGGFSGGGGGGCR